MNRCVHLERNLSDGFVCLSANCNEDRIVCCQHCFLQYHPHETIEFTKFNEVADKLKPLTEIDRKKLEFLRLARDTEISCRAILNNFVRQNVSKITQGVDMLVFGHAQSQPDRMLKRLMKEQASRLCIIHGDNYEQLMDETYTAMKTIEKLSEDLGRLREDVNFLVGSLTQRLQSSDTPIHQEQRILAGMLQLLDTTHDSTSTTDFETFAATGSFD